MAKSKKAPKEVKPKTLAELESKAALPLPEVAEERTVKVKCIREFDIVEGKKTRTVRPNEIVLLTESEAKNFCDRKFAGYHPFYGYMPEIGPLMEDSANPLQRKKIARAERVA